MMRCRYCSFFSFDFSVSSRENLLLWDCGVEMEGSSPKDLLLLTLWLPEKWSMLSSGLVERVSLGGLASCRS
jgi:hypothetical protein